MMDDLTLRELQTESARALSTMQATNNNIYKFNKLAHHDSQKWYRAVIQWYVDEYGDLPSRTGPGVQIRLVSEDV
jgi:hypothetical protein|tara:strand:- start:260 stop:484 length:225 start_codon:yes stop_codon:yes gene_type:complete